MNTHPNDNVPLILITNDDGIESPGLVAAVDAARRVGRVVVAAPTTQQTARGRAMTGDRDDYFHPMDLEQDIATRLPSEGPLYPVEAWHIDASPALVVRHALAVLCPDRNPDLVLSGINYGENLGNNITISGTVGAALQAAAQGVPAIAVSRQTEIEHHYAYQKLDWSESARVTHTWLNFVLRAIAAAPEYQLPFSVLKIDVPDPCTPDTEERLTTLSRQPYFRSRIEQPHRRTPLNAARTFIEADPALLDPLDDIYALAVDRVVSVTPLSLDNTAPLEPTRIFLEGALSGLGKGMEK